MTFQPGDTLTAAAMNEFIPEPGELLGGASSGPNKVPVSISIGSALAIDGTELNLAAMAPTTLLGNAGTVSAVPGAIEIGGGLSLSTGGTLDLAQLAAGKLLGNSGTVAAVPGGIAVGANLTLADGTLAATGNTGVSSVVTGTGLTGGPITSAGTILLANRTAQTLMGNSGTVAAAPSDITLRPSQFEFVGGILGLITGPSIAFDRSDGLALILREFGISVDPQKNSAIEVQSQGGAGTRIGIRGAGTDNVPRFSGFRSRGGLETPEPILNNDTLTAYNARGWNGVDFGNDEQVARIAAIASGDWSTISTPVRFVFSTIPTGGIASIDRLTILDNGDVLISNTGTFPNDDGHALRVLGGVRFDEAAVDDLLSVGSIAINGATALKAFGSGLSLSGGGTLSATGTGGTVTSVVVGGGLHPTGTITSSGTVAADWNGGTITALGNGIRNNSGSLESRGIANTITATTTATISPANGVTGAVVQFGTTDFTLNINAGSYNQQPLTVELIQGATAHILTLGTTIGLGTTNASFTATPSANATDYLQFAWSSAASKWRYLAPSQGFS